MKTETTKNGDVSLRKTYELKLKLDLHQQNVLNSLICEYKKVQAFVAKKAMKDIIYNFRQLPEEKTEEGRCKKCYNPKNPKEKKLKYVWINEKGERELNCGCLLSHISLRKIFLPSKNYTVHPEWDMRLAGKLYDSEVPLKSGVDRGEKYNRDFYDYCLKKTSETIRSQIALNRKIDKKIEQEDKLLRLLSSASTTKTVFVELKKKNITTLARIAKEIKRVEKGITRLEKRKAADINFHTATIRFPPRYCFVDIVDGEYKMIFSKFCKKPMVTEFYGKKRKDIDIKSLFGQEVVPELDLVFKKDNFWVQYIYRVAIKETIPTDKMTPVGVSFGLRTRACVIFEKNGKRIVKFWNGRPYIRQARQFFKINRIWQSRQKRKHSRSWYFNRVRAFSLLRYTNTETHKLSRDILAYISKNVKNPVIVLHDLKDVDFYITRSHIPIRLLKSKGKRITKTHNFNNWLLKKWNYRMFAQQIEYKANWECIPTVYLKYKYECPNCGTKNFKGYSNANYHCVNCGYTANDRYVAATTLMKRYLYVELKKIKNKWIEWHQPKSSASKE